MDDELRDLERRLRADPADARVQAALLRAQQRLADHSFPVELARILATFRVVEHRDALLVAQLVRDVVSKNWGVAFRFQSEREAAVEHYGTPRDGVYVEVRCFWNEREERHEKPPARYSFCFERRVTGGPGTSGLDAVIQRRLDQVALGWEVGAEVRAWSDATIRDDGRRAERWLEILEAMRAQHVLAVDPTDQLP